MKPSTLVSLLALAVAFSGGSYAIPANRYPIKRAKSTGAYISADTGPVPSFSVGSAGAAGIKNLFDVLYSLDITICGQVITVALDTGSTGEPLLHLAYDVV